MDIASAEAVTRLEHSVLSVKNRDSPCRAGGDFCDRTWNYRVLDTQSSRVSRRGWHKVMKIAGTLPFTETITPADQAAVAEAVRNAAGKGLAVYPVGGGTMLDFGAKPTRPGIALSLSKLNRVIDYPAADLTITVEAGMTLAELAKCLAAQRQRLPIDVPQPDRATVGGAVAVNAAGPRRYAYGTMRDYVLGLTAVDGAGTIFSGGGRVVKNAAGYNMCRLMAGSLGTLGIVTQVTLMVRPLPEASVFLVCELPDFKVAEKLLADLVVSPARPAAIELVAGRQAPRRPRFGAGAGRPRRPAVRRFRGARGGSRLDGRAVAGRVGRGRRRRGDAGAHPRAEPLWRRLTEFPADLQIHVLPSATVETIAKVLEIHPNCAIQAHAGDGVIRIKLEEGREERGEGRELGTSVASGAAADDHSGLGALRRVAAAAGGKMIVWKNPDGAALSAAEVWGPPSPEFRVMQAIKDRFDPENILNPGRFIL